MRIDRVTLNEIDPLRMFTHESVFPQKHNEEQEKEEEEEDNDDKRILEIWLSMVKDKAQVLAEAEDPLIGLFNLGPNLPNLVKLLNRSDVQKQIQDKLKHKESRDPQKRAESYKVEENLHLINSRIEKENQIWFRRIPLLARIFWQLEKVNIPGHP